MRVLRPLHFLAILLGMAVASGSSVLAQSNSCEDISKDVSAAIQKDPDKVLMIVEDALVINESCACEIIKAAIVAAKADAATVNQIVQTGISVAPKMSGVITDCATAAAPGTNITNQAEATAVVPSGKNPDKSIVPIAPPEDEEFNPVGPGIRDVYLIQPPTSGYPPRKRCHIPTSPSSSTP